MNSFHPSHPYILENKVVLLRPLTANDLAHLLPFAMREPELWKYSLLSASGEDNMRNYLNKALGERELGTSLPFIVWDKRTQKYAGSTRFYDIQENHETTQLGYTWYGKDFQGTGLNKNCKYLLLQFAFDVMKVKRVEFRADANNARSIAAMKSLGCVEEGILRSNCNSPDGRRDSIILSILQSEWQKDVKQQLKNKI